MISHLHPDHHADLVALRHYLRYGLEPAGSVPLHAPAELRARYDAFLGEPDFLAGLPGADLAPGILEIGGFRVEVKPVTHALNSFGFRITAAGDESGPGLVYSGRLRPVAGPPAADSRRGHAAERGLLGRRARHGRGRIT